MPDIRSNRETGNAMTIGIVLADNADRLEKIRVFQTGHCQKKMTLERSRVVFHDYLHDFCDTPCIAESRREFTRYAAFGFAEAIYWQYPDLSRYQNELIFDDADEFVKL